MLQELYESMREQRGRLKAKLDAHDAAEPRLSDDRDQDFDDLMNEWAHRRDELVKALDDMDRRLNYDEWD